MPVPIQKTAYVTEGQGRLISRYKNATVLQGLLAVYLGEVQFLENVLFDVLNKRFISPAANANPSGTTSDVLEQIGKLVGEDRSGLNNALYGGVLYLRIRANASDGLAEDIIQIAAMMRVLSGRYLLTLPSSSTVTNNSPNVTVSLPLTYLYVGDTIEFSNQPGVQYLIQSIGAGSLILGTPGGLATPFTGPTASGITLTLDSYGPPPTGSFVAPTGSAAYLEAYPAAFLVEVWNLQSQLAGLNVLSIARDPGVYGVLHYTTPLFAYLNVLASRATPFDLGSATVTTGSATVATVNNLVGGIVGGDRVTFDGGSTIYTISSVAAFSVTLTSPYPGPSAQGVDMRQLSILTGTITATNGSGTLSSSATVIDLEVSDTIEVSSQPGVLYEITALGTNTITISPAFSGTTASGLTIIRLAGLPTTAQAPTARFGSRYGGVTNPALYCAAVVL